MNSRLVLFFDTYIVSSMGNKFDSKGDPNRLLILNQIREKYPTYRYQDKIDIVKYVLCSYSVLPWDHIIIRFECEDELQNESFMLFCLSLFPSAKILNQRSASAKQYLNALSETGLNDRDWIFFSPNNDHPYLAHPESLVKLIEIADNLVNNFTNKNISINYSHFNEGILSNYWRDPLYGYYLKSTKQVLHENELCFVTLPSRLIIDSIGIFKLEYLKKIFSNTNNSDRLIRLEDTEFYGSRNYSHITIIPKTELCRHYDSYSGFNMTTYVPPLFIPFGFFDNDIKICYGYDNRIKDHISVNPNVASIGKEVDLPILLEDLPFFWRSRISVLDINTEFIEPTDKSMLLYYQNFKNPWHQTPKILFVMRSLYRVISFKVYFAVRYLVHLTGLKKYRWRNLSNL